jgi:hypothetical protein
MVLALAVACVCGAARAQCFVDPFTGQQICVPVNLGWQPISAVCPVVESTPSSDIGAHCRIGVADGSTGSGTLVGVDKTVGLVLTCSHLFDGDTEGIVVSFPSGRRYAARLIERDPRHDLAALAIQTPNVAPLVVSNEQPSGLLSACGFGPNGQFRCVRGGVTGQAVAAGATYPSLTISGAVRPGDSGGAVLNARGELVGVVWGQRDGLTYATCGRPLREFLGRIRSRFGRDDAPAPMPVGLEARLSAIDRRLRELDAKKQDKGTYLQAGDLSGYLRIEDAPRLDTDEFARRSEVEGRLKALATRVESIHSRVDSVREHVQRVAANRAGFFQGLSLGKLAVGALGLSGPLALAVVIAGGLAGRRLKKWRTVTQPIAIDSPPPPQRSVPETHYVPVEQDTFAKAHQWASEHVARKYPGATEVLQALESLIKQYLAAKG